MGQDFLPRQDVALIDSANRTTTPFYVFLQSLERALAQGLITPEQFAALEARVKALEDASQSDFVLIGVASVLVQGSVAGGMVQLTLQGDENQPAVTHYYGTNADGARGWHSVASAFAEGANVTLTTDPDTGVTTIATAASAQVFNRIDTSGDIRVTADGSLRITD